MTNENNHSTFNKQCNCSNSNHQNSSLNSVHGNKPPKIVEPLPESSRPRRDGPGGEDGD
ncbi:hypothetical protein HBE96_21570 [Clostridium sp. P21]|uniref:Uncharacterized protein n=1 Tax=Clostridium muellerianum TaxID=2716538 RepID=A0A7Y0HQV9_9CLOT|nr:hypothetical protein [Clostridium muellerianum]NMM65177.1 hypothetical protein [Clostridium muellerianum]